MPETRSAEPPAESWREPVLAIVEKLSFEEDPTSFTVLLEALADRHRLDDEADEE